MQGITERERTASEPPRHGGFDVPRFPLAGTGYYREAEFVGYYTYVPDYPGRRTFFDRVALLVDRICALGRLPPYKRLGPVLKPRR